MRGALRLYMNGLVDFNELRVTRFSFVRVREALITLLHLPCVQKAHVSPHSKAGLEVALIRANHWVRVNH